MGVGRHAVSGEGTQGYPATSHKLPTLWKQIPSGPLPSETPVHWIHVPSRMVLSRELLLTIPSKQELLSAGTLAEASPSHYSELTCALVTGALA